jgi:hypothetical protein
MSSVLRTGYGYRKLTSKRLEPLSPQLVARHEMKQVDREARPTHVRASDCGRCGETFDEAQKSTSGQESCRYDRGRWGHCQKSSLRPKFRRARQVGGEVTIVSPLSPSNVLLTRCLPGRASGLDDIRPASFKNATMEPIKRSMVFRTSPRLSGASLLPVNVIPPITTPS